MIGTVGGGRGYVEHRLRPHPPFGQKLALHETDHLPANIWGKIAGHEPAHRRKIIAMAHFHTAAVPVKTYPDACSWKVHAHDSLYHRIRFGAHLSRLIWLANRLQDVCELAHHPHVG